VPGASWIDHDEDRALARQVLQETDGFTPEQMLRYVISFSHKERPAWVEKRARYVMRMYERLGDELRGWLKECLPAQAAFLDLGCGPGQLLAAAALAGHAGIGIDVRLVWLLVAQRFIRSVGGTPVLAAAMAESLPLADNSIHGLISLDVIEHVGNPSAYLREINRVMAPRSHGALATPNRFSLAAEPHVSVWGVGWLPRKWQEPYVKKRSGLRYDFIQMLSARELRRLFRENTQITIEIVIPPVPPGEIAAFPWYRKVLASAYNLCASWKVLRPLFLAIGPFFRILGKKR
jgi:SAM-dependent methyltransferase